MDIWIMQQGETVEIFSTLKGALKEAQRICAELGIPNPQVHREEFPESWVVTGPTTSKGVPMDIVIYPQTLRE